jgi:uncharacterized protein (DUF486 family)
VQPFRDNFSIKRKTPRAASRAAIFPCRQVFVILRAMNPTNATILLLTASNVFMTFAWYAHLKHLGSRPLLVAVLVSWGIAFFEYLIQVPANRIGFQQLSLPQLKMLQEVITLSVFVPFSILYMRQPIRVDFLWAAICLCGAVYFMFRGAAMAG